MMTLAGVAGDIYGVPSMVAVSHYSISAMEDMSCFDLLHRYR